MLDATLQLLTIIINIFYIEYSWKWQLTRQGVTRVHLEVGMRFLSMWSYLNELKIFVLEATLKLFVRIIITFDNENERKWHPTRKSLYIGTLIFNSVLAQSC